MLKPIVWFENHIEIKTIQKDKFLSMNEKYGHLESAGPFFGQTVGPLQFKLRAGTGATFWPYSWISWLQWPVSIVFILWTIPLTVCTHCNVFMFHKYELFNVWQLPELGVPVCWADFRQVARVSIGMYSVYLPNCYYVNRQRVRKSESLEKVTIPTY